MESLGPTDRDLDRLDKLPLWLDGEQYSVKFHVATIISTDMLVKLNLQISWSYVTENTVSSTKEAYRAVQGRDMRSQEHHNFGQCAKSST